MSLCEEIRARLTEATEAVLIDVAIEVVPGARTRLIAFPVETPRTVGAGGASGPTIVVCRQPVDAECGQDDSNNDPEIATSRVVVVFVSAGIFLAVQRFLDWLSRTGACPD